MVGVFISIFTIVLGFIVLVFWVRGILKIDKGSERKDAKIPKTRIKVQFLLGIALVLIGCIGIKIFCGM